MRSLKEYEAMLNEIIELNKQSYSYHKELKKLERISLTDWEYGIKKRKKEMYWTEYDKVTRKVLELKRTIKQETKEHVNEPYIKEYLQRLEVERSHNENEVYQSNKALR